MRRTVRGRIAAAVAVLLASSAVSSAADLAGAGSDRRLAAAAAAAAAARPVPHSALAQGAPQQSGATTAEPSQGFFRTARGKVVLGMFLAGTAWVIYSTRDDRKPVKSPIR